MNPQVRTDMAAQQYLDVAAGRAGGFLLAGHGQAVVADTGRISLV